MGDAADDAERRAEQEMEEQGIRVKLPTRTETVYSVQSSDEVVILIGTITSGLEAILFDNEEAADDWLKKSFVSEYDRLDVCKPRTYTREVPYNPDLEEG